jgi:hypothetical protein
MNTPALTVVQQVLMGTITGIVTDTTSGGPVAGLATRALGDGSPLWSDVATGTGIAPEIALAAAVLLTVFAALLLRAGVGAAVRKAVRQTGAGGGATPGEEERVRLFEREAAYLGFGVGALVGLILFGGVLSAALCGAGFVLIGQGGVRDAL